MINLSIKLRNPPSDAEEWDLVLTDWYIRVPIHFVGRNGKDRLGITEVATFEIPDGLTWPLRIVGLHIWKWILWEGTPALQQLYGIQSVHSTLWDWDEGGYGIEPDPTFRAVFIPRLGNYAYNVATETLVEEVVPEPEFSGFAIADYSKN